MIKIRVQYLNESELNHLIEHLEKHYLILSVMKSSKEITRRDKYLAAFIEMQLLKND